MHYKNIKIENIDGEIWVDVFGYDGIYSVSNLGRVKSERRLVNNGQGGRWVKERMLKQAKCSDGRLSVNLSINNIVTSKQVSQIVWTSFNETDTPIGKCVMHKNKIALDNRLSNLECVTWSISHSRNFQLGLLPHLEDIHTKMLGSKYNEKNGIYNGNLLIEKLCNKCFEHKPTEDFELERNTCKFCRNINAGVKDVGKLKYLTELKMAGLKKCPKCTDVKSILDFHKGSSKCKLCTKLLRLSLL